MAQPDPDETLPRAPPEAARWTPYIPRSILARTVTVGCPDAEEFAALLAHALDAERRAAIIDHAAGCQSCHAMVRELASDVATAASRSAPICTSYSTGAM